MSAGAPVQEVDVTQLDHNDGAAPQQPSPPRDDPSSQLPRVAVASDQDWDGRAWTGREADRPAAITDADRTQVVRDPAAGSDPERTQWVSDPGSGAERTQVVADSDGAAAANTQIVGDSASGDAERTQWVPPERVGRAPENPSGPPPRLDPDRGPGGRGPGPRPLIDGRQRGGPGGPGPEQPPVARSSGVGAIGQAAPAPPPGPRSPMGRQSGPAHPAGPPQPAGSPRPPFPPRTGAPAPPPGPPVRPRPPEPARPRAEAPAGAAGRPGQYPSEAAPANHWVQPGPGPDDVAELGEVVEDDLEHATDAGIERKDEEGPVEDEPGDRGSALVPLPASEDVAVRGLAREGLTSSLVAAAREAWPPIDAELLDDATAAGETAHVRALTDPREPVWSGAPATAVARTEEAAETAVAVSRLADRHEPGRAEWGQGGTVIPVLGASAHVGASVVAVALFDALDACGVGTLLVDAADPSRSGLAAAVANQGTPAKTLHPKIGIDYARRGDGWVAQLNTPPTEVLSARMVPSPSWWLPDQTAPAATVIDLGWDPWQIAAAPLRGAGSWLEAGHPSSPRPVLVVEPNRPSLARANQLLTRLRPWISAGHIAAPAALVVIAARRWPKQITGVAAQALGELMEHAVFLPYDRDVEAGGIGPGPVSDRLRTAAAAIPARWGLMPNNLAPGGGLPSLTRLFSRGR